MRFIRFLQSSCRWQAHYRGMQLDATRARAVLQQLLPQLPALAQDRLQVFVAQHPLQALMAYFLASWCGLRLAVVSPRGLAKLLDGLALSEVGFVIAPEGVRLPDTQLTVCRVQLRFDESAAAFSATEPAEALLDQADNLPATQAAQLVFCTSGTTGKAKRVIHDEQVLLANAQVVQRYLHLHDQDHSYCVFPLHYMYGLSTTLCALWSDSRVSFNEFIQPQQLASAVQQQGVTVLPILGEWCAALATAWQQQAFAPQRLLIINASDRLLQHQAQQLLPIATEFWNNLGQTESAPRLFAIELKALPELAHACHQGIVAVGRPVDPSIHLELRDCFRASSGKLFYQTPFLMRGYLHDDGHIEPPPHWIDSGDLFHCDAQGLWYWLGRDSHSLKVQGELISLRTVTDQLLEHQDVTGVGYTTNAHGDLCAFIESHRECPQLSAELSSMLTRFLRGRRMRVQLLQSLPRTESGKIDFYQLNQRAMQVQPSSLSA